MSEAILAVEKERSNLILDQRKLDDLKNKSIDYKSLTLNERHLCDLEMILNQGFYPLKGFLDKENYESVLENMSLADGSIWPIPICLDVNQEFVKSIKLNDKIVLRDYEGVALAVLTISSIWKVNKKKEAILIYKTKDTKHPGVDYLYNQVNEYYIGGRLEGLQLPIHYDYKNFRHTPMELKSIFKKNGWDKVVGFQTRNPMHRAHKELTVKAAKDVDAKILIHPVVGLTKPGDIDHYTRVRCYQEILKHYPKNSVILSLIPIAMRMAGPREALWHAIIRKNYGCSHFIVGRDHAGPGNDSTNKPFYGPYEAQEIVKKYESNIGIKMVPFKMMVYVNEIKDYMPIDQIPDNLTKENISGTDLRSKLEKGKEIPEWFSYPNVVNELRRSYPAKQKRGFTVFFTGLSGSGKSTIANALLVKLMENGKRRVTLLDGDIVRINLSSELGFSKEHRDLNIRRIGFVASEITKNGGIALCAPIAPYKNIRLENRSLISNLGGFIEVYVSTPIEVCEKRDVKGLYAKARKGLIKGFTGIDDPYEKPENPEVTIDTSKMNHEDSVQKVINYLERQGYLG